MYFADEDSFDDWYADSALSMLAYQVMEGYDDGEFKGDETVNRAQLAVILDRFAENVLQLNLADEPYSCTEEAVTGLIIYLQNNKGESLAGAAIESSRGEIGVTGDEGTYDGLVEGSGYYTFTISVDGYNDHTETIILEQSDCHVITQYKTITLF